MQISPSRIVPSSCESSVRLLPVDVACRLHCSRSSQDAWPAAAPSRRSSPNERSTTSSSRPPPAQRSIKPSAKSATAATESGPDVGKRIHQRHFERAIEEVVAGKSVMQQSLFDSDATSSDDPAVRAMQADE
jgi:hypothetical protein